MSDQQTINYQRIAKAINYIQHNFKNQPSLDEIAAAIGLSPFYFQKTFTEWAGVSPKKFIQYLSLNYAKQLLKKNRSSLLNTALQTGYSSPSRLYDLFVGIEAMTPGDYKNGGENLTINYHFYQSPFGQIIMASTTKGICHLFFEESQEKGLLELQLRFPNAYYQLTTDHFQQKALRGFYQQWDKLEPIKLHLNGTSFQLKVWEALLSIPPARLQTYGNLAHDINKPKASRAVGTAIGSNPVAFLIPCHRVIQASGHIGGYRWGSTRKSAIIGWEASKTAD